MGFSHPLSPEMKKIKKARDEEIRDVIAGRSDKMLVVIGPCSAHEPAPTLEYISRLGKLNEKVNWFLVFCLSEFEFVLKQKQEYKTFEKKKNTNEKTQFTNANSFWRFPLSPKESNQSRKKTRLTAV